MSRFQARNGDSEYLRLSHEVSQTIMIINKGGKQLTKIAALIGTPREPQGALDQIKSIVLDVKPKIKSAHAAIDALGRFDGGSAQEARSRRQEQSKYKLDLETATETFEKGMAFAVEKEKQALSNDRSGGSRGYDEYGDEKSSLVASNREDQALAQEARINNAFIQERVEGIRQLESDMVEVHEIFQDVAEIVQDQGQQLASIESNMVTAYERVDKGVNHLTRASRHQKSAKKKALWLLLIVAIAAGIVTVIVVTSTKKKKN